eukprot:scaffold1293_cov375-Prasinococcus_capsulatus_cf.AAC.9
MAGADWTSVEPIRPRPAGARSGRADRPCGRTSQRTDRSHAVLDAMIMPGHLGHDPFPIMIHDS